MNEKSLVTDKEAEKEKALESGIAIIKAALTKPGGKFSYFERHEKINPKTEKVVHCVCGYSSGLINVYIDSHNMEISAQGTDGSRILTSNQTLLASPDVFLDFLAEFQRHYEKLSVNAQRPKKH